jgi:SAM-dependent methyltransferase
MDSSAFYDKLAPFYHLIYQDWEASIQRQASALDSILKERWGGNVKEILDVACGVGTQSIGLASLGYAVTASDLSPESIERAKREAAARKLHINLSVADMREAYAHHQAQFDLVIACDNAVPHLLSDADLLHAFREIRRCVRPGGGFLLSVRDYEKEERSGVHVKPYGMRTEGSTRYLVFQVWEFTGPSYDVAMYFVEDKGGSECITHVMRSRYYAVGIETLKDLLSQAGFTDIQRIEGRFFQPVIVASARPEDT